MAEGVSFTEKASGVLFFSRYYSSWDGPRLVEPEHIPLALLLADPELFLRLFGSQSARIISALRADLRDYDSALRTTWLATEVAELSPAAKDLIDLAEQEAHKLGHSYVDTDHLLLALAERANSSHGRDRPTPVSGLLGQHGITPEMIKKTMKSDR